MGIFVHTTTGMGWEWEYDYGNEREWDRESHSRTSLIEIIYKNKFLILIKEWN